MAASLVSLKNGESSERSPKEPRAKNQRLHGRSIFLAYARPSVINSAFNGIGDGNSNTKPRLESRSMNAFSSPQLLIAGYFYERSITTASMHVIEYNWPHCHREARGSHADA